MHDLQNLREMEGELAPRFLPDSASLSVSGHMEVFEKLFHRASTVTPLKEVVPGTAYALFEAFPASDAALPYVRITASSGEQTVSTTSDRLRVLTPGRVLLAPKRVLDIVRLAPAATVDLTVVGSEAFIQSGRVQWAVSAPTEATFSNLIQTADLSEVEMTEIPAQPFLKALNAAGLSASKTSARPSLMQLLLKDGALTGCDGGRLHTAAVEGLDPTLETTIPLKVVAQLTQAAKEAETLLVGFNDDHLVFRIGDDSIVAQKLILDFPDVRPLMLEPKLANTHRLVVDRDQLEAAVRRVRVNADPDYAVVSLSIVKGPRSADDWAMEVRSKDRTGNAAKETLECFWKGKSRTVTYNHQHLLDLLQICTTEMVILKLGDDSRSVKTPLLVEDEEAGVTGILQQVSLNW